MPEQVQLAKAKLVEVELRSGSSDGRTIGDPVDVQFNPESLKLTYGNSVGKTDVTGTAGMQFISSSSAKLDLDLWFDATVDPEVDDVRTLSAHLHSLITPKPIAEQGEAKFIVPAVRFSWGSFLFEGVITSLNETLDLFSSEGRPLRSKSTVSIASQDIRFKIQSLEDSRGQGPGQTPQVPLADGDSVQQAAARSGSPGSWRDLATAAGIDNPRMPDLGAMIPVRRRS